MDISWDMFMGLIFFTINRWGSTEKPPTPRGDIDSKVISPWLHGHGAVWAAKLKFRENHKEDDTHIFSDKKTGLKLLVFVTSKYGCFIYKCFAYMT